MSLTDRQRQAAGAPGGVAITAGAGTGKTHTLGHRYLEHIRTGTSPLQMVAVTFTERAAQELRARVRAYAREAFDPADERLAELEAAPIATVHGLCLRICRDHPEAAGLPHDVSVLDPLEGGAWSAELLERVLADAPGELFLAMPYERVRDVLAGLLKDPYTAERALSHGPEGWPERIRAAREEARRALLDDPDVRAASAVLARLQGPASDKGEAARRAALASLTAASDADAPAALAWVRSYRTNVGAKGAWGDAQAELRGAITTVKRAVQAWADDPRSSLELGPVDDALASLLPTLREAFRGARAALTAAKRRRRVVDFADLEVHALRALGRPEVRAHYAARWHALLVDEVQDTSPVQEAILGHLSEFCRTTIVGDVKQSIYGFRGADARVFQALATRIEEAGGSRIDLDVSFRTHEGLVRASNEAFSVLLGAAHGPLSAHRSESPAEGPHLRLWLLEGTTGVPAGSLRLAEAHRIAHEIHTLLEDAVPVHDPDAPGGIRPVRASDVAVLARTWAPLDLLAEVLPALGVPVVHTGGGDLLGTREARDGEAALRFLADPHDDVALVALLRGPFFAVSDEVLARFAMAHVWRSGQGAVRPSWWTLLRAERPAELARAADVLDELLLARDADPPSRLLQRLDRATGWSAVVANLPGGPRRSADLEGFSELIRDLERGHGDVFAVARRLRRLRSAGAEAARPTLEGVDAVTLTTIHRSKGAEWPVVVIAALDAGSGGFPPAVRIDPGVGVAVLLDDADERRARPALWTLLETQEKAREEAEDRRILYVALTRARDLAVVSAAREKGPLLDLLWPSLQQARVVARPVRYDPARATWPAPPEPARPDVRESDLWRSRFRPADPGTGVRGPEDWLTSETLD